MKRNLTFAILLSLLVLGTVSCNKPEKEPPTNEEIDRTKLKALDEKYASMWSAAERKQADCAASLSYLNEVEKEVFYYQNLMRINPPLFARTYATDYTGDTGWAKGYAFDERKQSLLETLATLEPMPLLVPDGELYDSADCFATQGGALGVTGHNREGTTCEANPEMAECCDFGGCATGLAIVMHFLIDSGESNARLGHRQILLNGRLTRMGVAVRDHVRFQKMAVLDFKYGEAE